MMLIDTWVMILLTLCPLHLIFWVGGKLTMIARDVLVIPILRMASESAFSTKGQILDSFRSSLTPKVVEALVCSQNWLRSSH